ncbi:MAG TPA: TIGR01777 family protein [Bacteroidales bacterium]|nr:TIGR01777 family protein [Bacteroidales bacterium]
MVKVDDYRVVVVAGGTGLIGSWLVPLLVNNGYRVKLLSRNPSKVQVSDSNVETVKWSGKPDNALVSLLDNTTAVINLAGHNIATLWAKQNRKKIVESRILPTRALAQALNSCENPPRVFVQASAVGLYPYNSSSVLTESSTVGNGFLSSLVSNWENEALACANATRVLLIRTGVVLSSKGGFLPKIAKPTRYFAGVMLGGGNNIIPWIHVLDHVRAVKFLMDNPAASGAFNLTAPVSNSYADIARQVADFYHRPMLFRIPEFLLRLLPGGMANEVLLANQPVYPQRLVQLGFKWNFPKLENAIADLLAK